MPPEDVHVHVHVHVEPGGRTDEILELLRTIDARGTLMSKELDDLAAAVERAETVQDSAIQLIQGLSSKISDAGTDPKKLKALTDTLDRQAAELATAISTGTAVEGLANEPKDETDFGASTGDVSGIPGGAPGGTGTVSGLELGDTATAEPDATEEAVPPGTKVPLSAEEQAAASGNTEQTPTA